MKILPAAPHSLIPAGLVADMLPPAARAALTQAANYDRPHTGVNESTERTRRVHAAVEFVRSTWPEYFRKEAFDKPVSNTEMKRGKYLR